MMKQVASFKTKYLISISEYCSTKDISLLLEISPASAREIKRQVELICKKNNVVLYSKNRIPTEALLSFIDKDTEYYYHKMIDEGKVVNYVCSQE